VRKGTRTILFTSALLAVLLLVFSCTQPQANRPPKWTQPSYTVNGVAGQVVSFDLAGKVSDPDGDTVTVTIERKPEGVEASIANNKLSFTPASEGTYEFILKASDGKGGEAEAGLVVVVSRVPNSAPVWTKVSYTASAVVGQLFEFDLAGKVSDPDGDTITIEIISGPTGASIENDKLKFTPTSVSVYEFILKASDGKGGEAETGLVVISTKFILSSQYSANLRVYVTAYKSGWAVEDAIVKVLDSSENLIAAGVTNDKGLVDIPVPLANPVDFVNVLVEKEGHAKTYIEGLRLVDGQSFQFETQARVAKLGKTISHKPFNLDVTVLDGNGNPLTNNVVTTDTIRVIGTVEPLEYSFNLWYVKVGGVPGTGTFTSPRVIGYDGNIDATQSVTAFDGLTPIFIDVYDQNDNRYEKIIYVNVSRPPIESINPYIVEKVTSGYNLISYTRRSFIEYYGKPNSPNAAPKDTNLYVTVRWRPWYSASGKTAPKGYKVYRSFDGLTFEPVAVLPPTSSLYNDYSAKLEPGKKVWYAVSSLYDGGYETPYTIIGSVEPLPMFDIEYVYPKNGSTNVPVDPTFKWKFIGPETTSEGNVTYVWDIWLLDITVNDNAWYSLGSTLTTTSAFGFVPAVAGTNQVEVKFSDYTNPSSSIRWVDYIGGQWYPYDKLQANKTYEWANRSLWAQVIDASDNTISYSIYCDEVNRLGLGTLRAEIYNRFVTGSN